MRRLIVLCYCLLVLSACNQPYDAPQYDVKTIKPKLIPYTAWKKDKDAAIKLATLEIDRNAKNSCRSIDTGWSLKEVKSSGEMDCEETSVGHRCRRKNIELVCRQINMR